MGARFEVVSKYAGQEKELLPQRKTAHSAGYDFVTAEDIVIPPHLQGFHFLAHHTMVDSLFFTHRGEKYNLVDYAQMCNRMKTQQCGPTLVSTGVKCKLDPNTYLELSVRSSTPLKSGIILANGVGIIDADYYNNPGNEGEIFFQLINLTPVAIHIPAGTPIGQGIIKPYLITEDDAAEGERVGGFGSTDD